MRLRRPLDAALATQGHVRVLRALDGLPEGLAVSVRDLSRRAGLRHPRTSEILADLRLQGLASAQRAGRADLYQPNRAHVLYPFLHRLFDEERASEAELAEALSRGLAPAARHIKEAYLFGSVARGDSDVTSDVDLAIVASRPDAALLTKTIEALAAAVKQRFGNDLSVQLSDEPVEKRRHARDPSRELWDRVAREGVSVLPGKRARHA